MLNAILQYHWMPFFYTPEWFSYILFPFTHISSKAANCCLCGRTVLYSEILSLVLKCPFLQEVMGDSRYQLFFNNVLTGKIKTAYVWPPSPSGNCTGL